MKKKSITYQFIAQGYSKYLYNHQQKLEYVSNKY